MFAWIINKRLWRLWRLWRSRVVVHSSQSSGRVNSTDDSQTWIHFWEGPYRKREWILVACDAELPLARRGMIAPYEPVQPPAALDLSHALELRTKSTVLQDILQLFHRSPATMSASALLTERDRLEARLIEVQLALASKGIANDSGSACSCAPDGDAQGLSGSLALAIGVRAQTMRLLLLLVLFSLAWMRGRAIMRSVGIMWLVTTINVWARLRRLKKWILSQVKSPATIKGRANAGVAAAADR